jgi:hypothetical protein
MDLNELERRIPLDKSLQTKDNYLALYRHHALLYESLSPKEKYHGKDKLAHFIHLAFKTGDYTVDDLKFYVDTLGKLKTENRWFSQIIGKYYELIGGEPLTLATKLGGVAIESGTMAVSDSGFVPRPYTDADTFEKELLEDMNQGRIFYWGTGGDGGFGAILRCIDGQEPSVNPKEFRFIQSSSSTAVISVPSGELVVTDIGLDIADSKVRIKVEPGNYLVRAHLKDLYDKFFGFVIVVCKTDLPAVNNITEIEGLG